MLSYLDFEDVSALSATCKQMYNQCHAHVARKRRRRRPSSFDLSVDCDRDESGRLTCGREWRRKLKMYTSRMRYWHETSVDITNYGNCVRHHPISEARQFARALLANKSCKVTFDYEGCEHQPFRRLMGYENIPTFESKMCLRMRKEMAEYRGELSPVIQHVYWPRMFAAIFMFDFAACRCGKYGERRFYSLSDFLSGVHDFLWNAPWLHHLALRVCSSTENIPEQIAVRGMEFCTREFFDPSPILRCLATKPPCSYYVYKYYRGLDYALQHDHECSDLD